MAAREALLDFGGLSTLACEPKLAQHSGGVAALRRRKTLTSTRRTDENHSDLVGRDRTAGGSRLELLNARVDGADDILKLLELVLDETHLWRLRKVELEVGLVRNWRGSLEILERQRLY